MSSGLAHTAESGDNVVAQQFSPSTGSVLRVGPLKPSLEDTLTDRYDAARLPDGAARTEFLAEHGDAVTAVVTSGRTGVDAALMDALPTSGRSSTSASVMTPPTWNAPPNWGSA